MPDGNGPRVIWEPNAGNQVRALQCPAWELLIHGPRGGGKSDVLLMDYAQDVGVGFGPAWRGIIFRRSYKQLADVVARSRKWFSLVFPTARLNESDMVWKFNTGEELLLRYFTRLSDYDQYHGWEVPWQGWEELTTHPDRAGYEKMKSISRSSHPGMPRKIRSNTNPLGVGHNWVRSDFIDQAPSGVLFGPVGRRKCHLQLMLDENPVLLKNDPQYKLKLAEIRDENLRKAWLEGSWDIVAGGMFDDVWDDRVHFIQPFKIPSDWRIEHAFDWGSSAPYSLGIWAHASGSPAVLQDGTTRHFVRGSKIRIGELYGWNGQPNEGLRHVNSKIAEDIIALETRMGIVDRVQAGPADASIFDVVNGRCMYDDFSEKGVYFKACNKGPGSRVNGWETMRNMFENATGNELPGLFVFNTCRQFRRTVPTLPRDETNLQDVDSASEDHIGDETRYECQSEVSEVVVQKMFRRH